MLMGRDRPLWLVIYDRACRVFAVVVLLKVIGVPLDERFMLPLFVALVALLVVRTLSWPTLVCAVGLGLLFSLANALEPDYVAALTLTFVCAGALLDGIQYLVIERPNRRPMIEHLLEVPRPPVDLTQVFD